MQGGFGYIQAARTAPNAKFKHKKAVDTAYGKNSSPPTKQFETSSGKMPHFHCLARVKRVLNPHASSNEV
jgi:hypothetical protein